MKGQNHLPIDKGWAWVITFATCGIFGFITGSQKSRGIILVELKERFPDSSVTLLIWVLNINFLTDRVLGPLNGLLLSRTSNRILSICGSCIMTASLIFFAFGPNVAVLLTAYAFYGWGTGMNALSSMTAYQPYFDKRKGLSLGITGSGSGVGTIVISAILRPLLDHFSFSGAILLYETQPKNLVIFLAGVCLQTLVLACLLRPFSYYERFNKISADSSSKKSEDGGSDKEDISLVTDNKDIDQEFRIRSFSVGEDQQRPLALPTTEFLSTPTNLHKPDIYKPQHTDIYKPQHTDRLRLSNAEVFALSAQDVTTTTLVLDGIKSAGTKKITKSNGNQKFLFNWSLVYNPRCIMVGLSTLLHVSALMASYPSIPPLGQQSGVSKELISILLMAAGALEIPLRMFNGWIADQKLISAYNQLALSMLINGIMALLCAIISSTAGIVLILIGLSSVGTSVFTLLPVVVGELFGSANVRSGMAIIFVYQGLSIVVSSFCSGAIYEWTNRWENVFYYVSASMCTAALLMVITECIVYCINKHKTTNHH